MSYLHSKEEGNERKAPPRSGSYRLALVAQSTRLGGRVGDRHFDSIMVTAGPAASISRFN
jgi:hypothetical protein